MLEIIVKSRAYLIQQLLSVAVQRGNALAVMGTFSSTLINFFFLFFFVYYYYYRLQPHNSDPQREKNKIMRQIVMQTSNSNVVNQSNGVVADWGFTSPVGAGQVDSIENQHLALLNGHSLVIERKQWCGTVGSNVWVTSTNSLRHSHSCHHPKCSRILNICF